jgi:DNA-directed RNA polymerase subunit N
MMIPIRCFTCGNLIGDKFTTFTSRVKGGENAAEVLDDLGVKRYCCRRMLISSVDVIDQVIPFYTRQAESQ